MRHLTIAMLFFLLACNTAQKTSMYDYGNCPFKATNWMSVSDSVNKKSELSVNGSISLFLNSLNNLIKKGDTSDLPLLRAAINKSNQEYSISKAQVSQAFYESHLERSMKLCGIWNYIQNNKFTSPEDKLKYQETLDKLIIGIETENKTLSTVSINQNNYGNGNQTNNNFINPNIFLHEEDTIRAGTNFELKFINENRIQINPRSGIWENPYVAVRFEEKDCLLNLESSSGITMNYRGGEVPADKTIYMFSFMSTINKSLPAFIKLKCKPSIIYFGDRSDEKKQFTYNLK